MFKSCSFFLLCALALGANSYHSKQSDPERLVLGFLNSGTERRGETPESLEKLQAAHLANLKKLGDEGKLLLAGPFLNGGAMRGICIFNTSSEKEAQSWMAKDAFVGKGYLKLKTYPFLANLDAFATPKEQLDLKNYCLVLVEKAPGARRASAEKWAQLQEEYVANVKEMAKDKILVLDGPVMTTRDRLRGLLIFQSMSETEINSYLMRDSNFRDGYLVAKVYKWMTSKGAFTTDRGH